MESSSSSVANPVPSTSNRARESRRRKKKMKTQHSQSQNPSEITQPQKFSWKSSTTQQIYSSKLLQALRKLHQTPSTSSSSPRRSRAVREAADRALAVAARGRTRWSRAILMRRLRLKFVNKVHKRKRVTGHTRSPAAKPRVEILKLKGKNINLPAVQRKVKTLGRLIPGCQKEGLPAILEEASDYIPALEMQIRSMRELLSRLSTAGEGSSSGSSAPGNGTD